MITLPSLTSIPFTTDSPTLGDSTAWTHELRALIDQIGPRFARREAHECEAFAERGGAAALDNGGGDPHAGTHAGYRAYLKEGVTDGTSERRPNASKGQCGWVIERTHSWLNRSRRLLVRWEKRVELYLAFLHLACAQLLFVKVTARRAADATTGDLTALTLAA